MRTKEEIESKINHFKKMIELDNEYLETHDCILETAGVQNHTYLQECKIAILEWVLKTETISYDLPKTTKP